MKDVDAIIVGGGLAGTTLAVCLARQKEDFLLFESSGRLGGKIETLVTGEAVFEFGPSSFADQPDDILDLLALLGMNHEIVPPAPAAANRFILKKGRIVRLPSKPPEIFTTKALSFGGRLRFLRELFYVTAPPSPQPSPIKGEGEVEGLDESVYDFFCRHFGREAADYFASPFVSGITAGDAKKLSLSASFPRMAEAEARSSSLICYLLSTRKTGRMTPRSLQLQKGMGSIFQRAAEKIGKEKIILNAPVRGIKPSADSCRVQTDDGEYRTEKLYLTLPAYAAAPLLEKDLPEVSRQMGQIDYTPVAVAHLKISRKEKYPFDGFGILFPPVEGRPLLGVLWNSSVFPQLYRDQTNHYLTVFAGGAQSRNVAGLDDTVLGKMIREEVVDLFGLEREPVIAHLRRHPRAIPQYHLGYNKILNCLRSASVSHPPLRFAGNYVGGVSMPKTVAHAMSLVGGWA